MKSSCSDLPASSSKCARTKRTVLCSVSLPCSKKKDTSPPCTTGNFKLADLVALGQVGVEIIFARKDAALGDVRAQRQTQLNRTLDRAFVHHRQGAGQSQIHRASLRVGLGTESGGRAAENFACVESWAWVLEADDDFVAVNLLEKSQGRALMRHLRKGFGDIRRNGAKSSVHSSQSSINCATPTPRACAPHSASGIRLLQIGLPITHPLHAHWHSTSLASCPISCITGMLAFAHGNAHAGQASQRGGQGEDVGQVVGQWVVRLVTQLPCDGGCHRPGNHIALLKGSVENRWQSCGEFFALANSRRRNSRATAHSCRS